MSLVLIAVVVWLLLCFGVVALLVAARRDDVHLHRQTPDELPGERSDDVAA